MKYRAITIKADEPTANGRVYPKEVLQKAVEEFNEKIKTKSVPVQLCSTGETPDCRFSIGTVTGVELSEDGELVFSALAIPFKKAFFDLLKVVDVVAIVDIDKSGIKSYDILYPYQTDTEEDMKALDADIFTHLRNLVDEQEDEIEEDAV
jgi:hypothetical protein